MSYDVYQCNKCRKTYSRLELIENRNYRTTKKGLIPVCPNCKSEKFGNYELKKVKVKNGSRNFRG